MVNPNQRKAKFIETISDTLTAITGNKSLSSNIAAICYKGSMLVSPFMLYRKATSAQ